MSFFEYDKSLKASTEINWKMLIYPNITFSDDLEKDSFIVVLKPILKYLLEKRKDLYITVLVPRHVTSLEMERVEQRYINLPTYPNSMRTHFDFFAIKAAINAMEEEYDIVYSHLPEHTPQLKNYFANETNLDPRFIGYLHWIELDENSPYPSRMTKANLSGILEMQECGVNSKWLKDLILQEAKKELSTTRIANLEKIIQPHYLGIESFTPRKTLDKNTILFNHRAGEYTGWNWFCEQMDELWKERTDFKVYTTIIEEKKPWLRKVNLKSRQEYLDFLKKEVRLGVGAFHMYSAWSVSVTDGLSQGIPYLLPADLCYPEMVGEKYKYFYYERHQFLSCVKDIFDLDPSKKFEWGSEFLWPTVLDKWFDGWKNIFEPASLLKDSKVYEGMVEFIQQKKKVTKKELLRFLGWGKTFRWSPYRNMLRNDERIKLTVSGYEIQS